MNILLIDNYDSFTWNLALQVKDITGKWPAVMHNDAPEICDLNGFDHILLSPGPGIPSEAGLLMQVIKQYAPYKNILGVCLGHQAIGAVFGAQLYNLPHVYHGVCTDVYVTCPDPVFEGIPGVFPAGRYHSWVVAKPLPDELEVLAADEAGNIMALRHKTYNVRGVQFHPESIMTPAGRQIITNWLNCSQK